ncbi:MAG: hypothetical protein ABL898_19555, partial [Hyphomicrobiaceae bacterium]
SVNKSVRTSVSKVGHRAKTVMNVLRVKISRNAWQTTNLDRSDNHIVTLQQASVDVKAIRPIASRSGTINVHRAKTVPSVQRRANVHVATTALATMIVEAMIAAATTQASASPTTYPPS